MLKSLNSYFIFIDIFFILFFRFIYTNSVQLNSVGHAMTVYQAGDKYDIEGLKELTKEFLVSRIDNENVFEILDFSSFFNNQYIKEECLNFIRKNALDVLKSENFKECDLIKLELIVNLDILNVKEVELFNAIERWAESRAEEKGNLIYLIMF